MKNWLLSLRRISLWLLCLGLVSGCQPLGKDSAQKRKSSPSKVMRVAVEVQPVAIRTVRQLVKGTGRVNAEEKVDLLTEIGGTVKKVYCREGDRVEKGALLLQLDDSTLKLDLEKARAELAREEENLKILKKEFERQLISAKDFADAKHKVHLLRLQKERMELALQKTVLRAPFPAIVTGCYVTAGERILPNTKVFSLLNPETMVVVLYVPESDLSHLWVGQKGWVYTERRKEPYSVKVLRLSQVVEEESGMVKVTLTVLPPREGLLVGSLVRVELLVQEKHKVPMIPKEAVLFRRGQKVVFLARRGRAEMRPVQLGLEQGSWVEVTEGLEGGEFVITEGHRNLEGGEEIQIFQLEGE